jgi:hypothetical protein
MLPSFKISMLAYILPSCPHLGLPLPFPIPRKMKRAEEATFQYHAPTPFGDLYPCKSLQDFS